MSGQIETGQTDGPVAAERGGASPPSRPGFSLWCFCGGLLQLIRCKTERIVVLTMFNAVCSSQSNFERRGPSAQHAPGKRVLCMKSFSFPVLRGADLTVSVPLLIQNSYVRWPLAFCSPTIYACGAASWGASSGGLLLVELRGVSGSLFDCSLLLETGFADLVKSLSFRVTF